MTGTDDHLAKVTYIFGAKSSSEPASAAPADTADGWYVEPDGAASPGAAPEATAPAKAARRVPTFVETAAYLETSARAPRARTRFEERTLLREEQEAAEPVPESAAELAARVEHVSMGALTRKGMSSWEMAEKLKAKDFDDSTIMTEVSRLERVGLLNDSELAETLVRTLQDRKGLGRSGISAELRRRHVDPDAIEEALAALDGDDEVSRAIEIAVKRAPQLRSLDTTTAKRRLGAFLMRKGYSGAAVSAAVSAALEPSSGPRFR